MTCHIMILCYNNKKLGCFKLSYAFNLRADPILNAYLELESILDIKENQIEKFEIGQSGKEREFKYFH